MSTFPYVPGRANGPAEWTRISGNGNQSRPFWNQDATILYYFSRRAGSGSDLLAQRLDPATKSPKGDPVTVKAFGRDLMLPTPQYIGYAVTGSRLILPLGQTHLDVWVAEQEH